MATLFAREGPADWDPDGDVDADARTQAALCEWTARPLSEVPKLIDSSDPDTLDPAARVAYCPACWDDDIATRRQPYIRRHWALWTAVHCPRHARWLSGRRPRTQFESRMNGWTDIWCSRPAWARAVDQQYDALLEASASGFRSDSFDTPTGGWSEFGVEVQRVLGRDSNTRMAPFAPGSIMASIASPAFVRLRRDVRAAMQIRPAHIRLDDIDLKGYTRPEPAWIANRVVCMAIATEFVRLLDERRPLFPRL